MDRPGEPEAARSAREVGQPRRLQVVFDAIQNDEWLANIIGWRDRNRLPGEHIFDLHEMFLSHEEMVASLKGEVPKEDRGIEEVAAPSDPKSSPIVEPEDPGVAVSAPA